MMDLDELFSVMKEKESTNYRCIHNASINCEYSKKNDCSTCGWNPDVQAERITEVRQKYKKEEPKPNEWQFLKEQ